jgi:hypothetical protein
MNIDEDVSKVIQSLLQMSNKDEFETDIYSFDDPGNHTPAYQYQESIDILEKTGIFLKPAEKNVYKETTGEYSVLLNQYFYYHVHVSRKKALNYFLNIIDSKAKELLDDSEQLKKVITIIFAKQLKLQTKQLLLSSPFVDSGEFKNVQLPKILKKLEKMGLIKIVSIDVLDDRIDFTIKGLDKLDEAYKEKGSYIEKEYLGNPVFHLDTLTGDYKWDKVKGTFDSLESYQFKMLKYLLENPNTPIKISDIYKRVWQSDFRDSNKSAVKDNLKHLREKLGITGRKDNRPGNIDRKYNDLILYL